ncbi:hypothetical protein [Phaeospirillum tilakii]|uniref:Lipoprotein n=1 Tax=Phaeospirillum tilakii TaxID=741673 RepID=A0ABW5C7S9_9PROT
MSGCRPGVLLTAALRGGALVAVLALASAPALAQWGGPPGPGPGPHHPHWGPPGGPPPDFGGWHRGRWWHGWHEGRDGWWWVTGGMWRWYPQPIYPAPAPVYVPAPAPAPVMVPGVYYYCANPAGYYPQVSACLMPWQTVQAPPQ